MFVFYVSYVQYDICTITRWQQRRHLICWAFYRTYIFNGHLPLKQEQVFSVTIEKESEFILAWYKLCTFWWKTRVSHFLFTQRHFITICLKHKKNAKWKHSYFMVGSQYENSVSNVLRADYRFTVLKCWENGCLHWLCCIS